MKIPLFKVYNAPDVGEEVAKTLQSGYVGQGPKVEEFEAALSSRFRWPYVLAVNSCTSALQLALHSCPFKGEVLTTPLTCFATTAAIINSGFRPRWVDVDSFGNMDLDDLERKFNGSVTAVMVVHYGGIPIDIKRLHEIITDKANVYGYIQSPRIVHDCAHAFGSRYNGHLLGGEFYGDEIYCYSFQAIKTLNTGDGGAMLIRDWDLYERLKKLRWFGLCRGSSRLEQNIEEVGFKYHMNDIAATIGICNLQGCDTLLKLQRENCDYYSMKLSDISRKPDPKYQTSGWVFPVRVPDRCVFDRLMGDKGIETGPAHSRNDKHECVSPWQESLPNTDIMERELTFLPSGWWLGPHDREKVVDAAREVLKDTWGL